jgi:hypothetical protein
MLPLVRSNPYITPEWTETDTRSAFDRYSIRQSCHLFVPASEVGSPSRVRPSGAGRLQRHYNPLAYMSHFLISQATKRVNKGLCAQFHR